MKLVYIAGPYRGRSEWDVHQNIQQAEYYAAEITKRRGDLFCVTPHKNTAYMGGLQPDIYFLEGTLELLRRCDYIYMLPNWESSAGAVAEKKLADELKIEDITKELDDEM